MATPSEFRSRPKPRSAASTTFLHARLLGLSGEELHREIQALPDSQRKELLSHVRAAVDADEGADDCCESDASPSSHSSGFEEPMHTRMKEELADLEAERDRLQRLAAGLGTLDDDDEEDDDILGAGGSEEEESDEDEYVSALRKRLQYARSNMSGLLSEHAQLRLQSDLLDSSDDPMQSAASKSTASRTFAPPERRRFDDKQSERSALKSDVDEQGGDDRSKLQRWRLWLEQEQLKPDSPESNSTHLTHSTPLEAELADDPENSDAESDGDEEIGEDEFLDMQKQLRESSRLLAELKAERSELIGQAGGDSRVREKAARLERMSAEANRLRGHPFDESLNMGDSDDDADDSPLFSSDDDEEDSLEAGINKAQEDAEQGFRELTEMRARLHGMYEELDGMADVGLPGLPSGLADSDDDSISLPSLDALSDPDIESDEDLRALRDLRRRARDDLHEDTDDIASMGLRALRRRAGIESDDDSAESEVSEEEESPDDKPAPVQEIALRPSNTKPLGELQTAGAACPHAMPDAVVNSGRGAFVNAAPYDLMQSGINSELVRAWMSGEMSGPLCLMRIMESVRCGHAAVTTKTRELHNVAGLYGAGAAALEGNMLSQLVGGLMSTPAPDSSILLGGALSPGTGAPSRALAEAVVNLWEGLDNRSSRTATEPFEGLSSQEINLALQARCLAVHPQRDKGDLQEFLKLHLLIEVLRQGHDDQVRTVGSTKQTKDTALREWLDMESAEFTKQAKDASEDNVGEWSESLSRLALVLSRQKEQLEASLDVLRKRGAYDVLGLTAEASDAEVQRAYRAQARILHPDRGGTTEVFQALQAAYESIAKERGGLNCAAENSGRSSDNADGAKKSTSKPAAKPEVDLAKGTETEKQQDESVDNVEASADCEEKVTSDTTTPEQTDGPETDVGAEKAAADEKEADAHADEASIPLSSPPDMKEDDVTDEIRAADADVDAEVEEAQGSQPKLDASVHEEPAEVDPKVKAAAAEAERLAASAAAAAEAAACVTVPIEIISTQAELALETAQMCARLARLGVEAAGVGTMAWVQVRSIANHLTDVAQQTAQAVTTVGRLAMDVPSGAMTVLGRVQKVGTKGEKMKEIVKASRELMQQLTSVAAKGDHAMTRSNELLEQVCATDKTLQRMGSMMEGSDAMCRSIAGVLDGLAGIAGKAADDAAVVAMSVGDVQMRTQRLLALVTAAEARAAKEKEEEEEQPETKDEDKDDKEDDKKSDSSDSDDEAEAWKKCSQRHKLLQRLNGEVLSLQKEVRSRVATSTVLLDPINVGQKETLFALVAEVLELARSEVSRAWRESVCASLDVEDGPALFPAAAEAAMDFVFAAAAWNEVASPSMEARLLRMASVVDAGMLQRLLENGLFKHCAALGRGQRGAELLQKRCDDVIAAFLSPCTWAGGLSRGAAAAAASSGTSEQSASKGSD